MKTLAVISRKGGTGKTSVSVNVAAALATPRRRVVILDLDPQGSASRWAEWGELPFAVEPFNVARGAGRFREKLESLEADLLILDTPPEVEEPTQLALLVADLALIPTGPSALDLWATKDAVAVAREARKERRGKRPGVALVPCRTVGRSRIARELPALLRALGEPVAPGIGNRVEVAVAAIEGRTVKPYTEAGREFQKLAAYVLKRLRKGK